jgi:hypothetical protein
MQPSLCVPRFSREVLSSQATSRFVRLVSAVVLRLFCVSPLWCDIKDTPWHMLYQQVVHALAEWYSQRPPSSLCHYCITARGFG